MESNDSKESCIYHKGNSESSPYHIYLSPYKQQESDDNCFYRGRQISAHYTEDAVVVYQAFSTAIGNYAIEHQNFVDCPNYNVTRMTWIKTNFTWMMFRSGWATKNNQECVLAIWLKRSAFDRYLSIAKKKGGGKESVRIQWDPYHNLSGNPITYRRAIQLGLKGVMGFTTGEDILAITDCTAFVQKRDLILGPHERIYPLREEIKLHIEIGADELVDNDHNKNQKNKKKNDNNDANNEKMDENNDNNDNKQRNKKKNKKKHNDDDDDEDVPVIKSKSKKVKTPNTKPALNTNSQNYNRKQFKDTLEDYSESDDDDDS